MLLRLERASPGAWRALSNCHQHGVSDADGPSITCLGRARECRARSPGAAGDARIVGASFPPLVHRLQSPLASSQPSPLRATATTSKYRRSVGSLLEMNVTSQRNWSVRAS